MVIVGLIGGLGNQLFQYAAALAIAQRSGMPLKMDVSGFESYKLHAYSLQHFRIPQEFASMQEVARLKRRAPRVIRRLGLDRLRPCHRRPWVREQHFHFDPNILSIRSSVYLDGHWQSDRYFKEIESLVRQRCIVITEPDPENAAMACRVQNSESVSVHIRRADYVTDSTTHTIHGICSLDYYHAAIQYVVARTADPSFFVFSDDPEWARANVLISHPVTFVSHNRADRNYEDLRLMNLCRHHIIANSTFSWWGAWLGAHPGKIVVAPRIWFHTKERDTRDLIPDEWVRM